MIGAAIWINQKHAGAHTSPKGAAPDMTPAPSFQSSRFDDAALAAAFSRAGRVPTAFTRLSESLLGDWLVESLMPSDDGVTTTYLARNELVMSGRWLLTTLRTQEEEAPFVSRWMGYDLLCKCYQVYWFDSTKTWAVSLSGGYDPAEKVMSLRGKLPNPLESSEPIALREELVFGNNQSFELRRSERHVGRELTSVALRFSRMVTP